MLCMHLFVFSTPNLKQWEYRHSNFNSKQLCLFKIVYMFTKSFFFCVPVYIYSYFILFCFFHLFNRSECIRLLFTTLAIFIVIEPPMSKCKRVFFYGIIVTSYRQVLIMIKFNIIINQQVVTKRDDKFIQVRHFSI